MLSAMLIFLFLAICQSLPSQLSPDRVQKAIEYNRTLTAYNRFSNQWDQQPPAQQPEIPSAINDVTKNGPFDQSVRPMFAILNRNQMQSIIGLWPFSSAMRQKINAKIASTECQFFQDQEYHFDDSTNSGTWIKMSFVVNQQADQTIKYIVMKADYQMTFNKVSCKKCLRKLKCYLTPDCKPHFWDKSHKEEVLHYMESRALIEFMTSQSPNRVTILQQLQNEYNQYLPKDYVQPELCNNAEKLNQLKKRQSSSSSSSSTSSQEIDKCDFDGNELNRALGAMQILQSDHFELHRLEENEIFNQQNFLLYKCKKQHQQLQNELTQLVSDGKINQALKKSIQSIINHNVLQKSKPFAIREAFFSPNLENQPRNLQYARIAVVKEHDWSYSLIVLGAKVKLIRPITAMQFEATNPGSAIQNCKTSRVFCGTETMQNGWKMTEETHAIFDKVFHVLADYMDQILKKKDQSSENME